MTTNDDPQWHDFPYKNGVYALNCETDIILVHIYNIGGERWNYRSDGFAYGYPFEPEAFKNSVYGPIKLPKL